ncbi:response regulator [Daejeonella sp.]|jgi:CRP-like cAMP-binding protein|uniref:response regulator n=1 Tax=Daejeonella sp. TaxID=2805397 RepID=UPI003784D4AE
MKKKILIIEDNNDIRESSMEILELAGYEVLQAENGKIGVELAQQHLPDMILCDIMMPELDGYGVLYLLSKNQNTENIPFIFLTAKTERADMRKGMEMGADDYLTKPFDDLELLNTIESRFHKHQKLESFYSQSFESLKHLVNQNHGLEELKKIIAERKVKYLRKKQIIYYEGDSISGIYLILSGKVKAIKLNDDGREFVTGMYGPEDYIGIQAMLSGDQYNETVEAIEDTAICLLPKETVNQLLDNYTDIGQKFIKVLSSNLIEKEEQLLQLAYHSVRKRMAEILLRLVKSSVDAGDELTIRISREDLASMAGMATETVSRTLSDFKDEIIIEKKGSLIQILDQSKLLKMKN